MKKSWLILAVFLFFFSSCATLNEKDSVSISSIDGEFAFGEMVFLHDLISGETEIIFYDIPEYFRNYMKSGSPRLYDDYFNVEQFTFYDEGYNIDDGILSYKLLLLAKISLLQNENLTSLLSRILQREVSVGSVQRSEMTKEAVRPLAISFDFDEDMYFSNSNAAALYRNENLSRVLYIFDLSQNKIEFVIGRRK